MKPKSSLVAYAMIAARTFFTALLFAAAFAITAFMVLEARRSFALSEADLAAQLSGVVYEDRFGFGFWISWAFVALVELSLLAVGWLLHLGSRHRYGALLLLVLFAIATFASHRACQREEQLWFAQRAGTHL